jgi:hypothetical protein
VLRRQPRRIGIAFFFVSFQSIINGLTAPSKGLRSRTDKCIFSSQMGKL